MENMRGWEAFTHLWRGEAATLDDLYRLLAFRGHSRATYAAALDDLLARGWLMQEGEAFALTALGHAVRQAVEAATDRNFYGPWGCLTQHELDELRDLLTRLRDSLA
ncbi:MAG: helix-turn-helix domain-containing protein [Anaerolineae bacterium]